MRYRSFHSAELSSIPGASASSRAFRNASARKRRLCTLNQRRRWAFGVIRRGRRRRHFFPDEPCGRGDDTASLTLPVPSVTDTATSAAVTSLPRRAAISRAASLATTVAEKRNLAVMQGGVMIFRYHIPASGALGSTEDHGTMLARRGSGEPTTYRDGMAGVMLGIIRPGGGTLCVPISAN